MGGDGARERFEAKVDRSDDHHLWRGATNSAGTGQVRIEGKLMSAQRAAWIFARGPLPEGTRVLACVVEPACVCPDHLSLDARRAPTKKAPRPRGSGSKRLLSPGVWQLTVSVGRYEDGTPRREFRNVHASSAVQAERLLVEFAAEVQSSSGPATKALRDLTVDEGIDRFLDEHLRGEKGREEKTIDDYRRVHEKWFSPHIGSRRVRDIDESDIDKLFGRMRRAGLSRSRMNQAKSLYMPFFRWAKRRHIITRSPMADFELPTSKHVARERTPPEVEELSLLLSEALVVIPDVAPLLALGAVTGMRRGELVGLRRNNLRGNTLIVDAAIDEGRRVKTTKTRRERKVTIDAGTKEMLARHCQAMDERAAMFGTEVPTDGFVFSNAPDCSVPMPPDYATKRVAVLKEHLGIENKKPETIELEDQALALYRTRPPSRNGRSGPAPRGGMSFREIGERLARSERWAINAVAAAERREQSALAGTTLDFDGSIIALRKFTSSELLDAGFNISMVAQRQGHGPQVLVKHYSKGRRSADEKAAEHLGRVVHGK